MKNLQYQPKDSAIVYFWALLIPLVLSVIISMFLYGSPVDTEGKYLILKEVWFVCLLRVLSAGLLIGLFFIYSKRQKIDFIKASGIKKKTNYINIALCIILGIGLVYFTAPIINIVSYLISLTGIDIQTGIDMPLTGIGDLVLALLMIALLPAISEELIYRGIIFNGLKKWGKWPAILLSALLFCLMHGAVEQFTYTFILGIVLGYLMWETGALWLCMLVHFVNNAVVLISMYVAPASALLAPSLVDILLAFGMLALSIGLVILVFFIMKKLKKKESPEMTLSSSEQNIAEPLMAKKKKEDGYMLAGGIVLAIFFTIIQGL